MNKYNAPDIVASIKSRILKWRGHIQRMSQDRVVKKILDEKIGERKTQTWINDVEVDLKQLKVRRWRSTSKALDQEVPQRKPRLKLKGRDDDDEESLNHSLLVWVHYALFTSMPFSVVETILSSDRSFSEHDCGWGSSRTTARFIVVIEKSKWKTSKMKCGHILCTLKRIALSTKVLEENNRHMS
ncbi:hypothetical protein C0J52_06792 [Blattella germanica]|nr:hypothetical protein C0J52_06792 [Blattella germanica]